ncbi:alpha/beta hydrolase family protein [Nocardia brasiliensis]|uniref:alpha/beta hydrolase family protein n=1 Tax=Nocardia brasiliensis TaxID=37326 RepID=UPI001893D21E|nr:lipase family protein [Nocardia brasiliensis]MBF6125588.1 lipase [Nocardia brasiliensis]
MASRLVQAFAMAAAAAVLVSGAAAAAPAPTPTPVAAGTLVSVDSAATIARPQGAATASRIVYWSTGPQEKPAQVTGRMFTPVGAAPEGGWPVMSWHHPTVGIAAACSPSTSGSEDYDNDVLSLWLAHGYAVVATDYVFLGDPGVEPYLDGRTEAANAIDIVRAARQADPALSNRWVAAGYSQGGHAALVTDTLASGRAPELELRATVAFAPVNHITEQLVLASTPGIPGAVTPDGLVALAMYMLRGLSLARPQFDLDPYLTALGRELVGEAGRLCLDDMIKRAAGIAAGDVFAKPLGEGQFPTVAESVFGLPPDGYKQPVFIAQGLDDQTVLPATTDLTVAELTAAHQLVTYRTYPGQTHETIADAAAVDGLAFSDKYIDS